MATSNTNDNVAQCKMCRRGEGDTNIWTARSSDNPDKQIQKCPNCQVLKSGPLFLSSKGGIGWTSWKKRWFILTRTSLVFYRSDPNAAPQKGSEANLTLGGIDLNNLGSVVVKADKKLLTVLFPDGRDGRTFTLKAETSEDLFEWKTALENALAQAPSPAFSTGQNGVFNSDVPDSLEASFEQWRDRRPSKSLVVGRPILLALEDIDGSPSFLEKALRFIEEYGIKVEGILRQSADVEEVHRRVREYEQGIVDFTPDEDAHVVADCIKHILRELPSSPVPATCCTSLVEAYRTDRGSRISAMRAAVAETFPEPNRRLVQRILKMMLTVSSHKSVNRMTLSAVAACMAPLLLRPLLAGDCELEDDFNMGGDGSLQLLQAAAAANHAQAIVIILLEEYERIFDEDLLQEGSLSSDLYSESEDGDLEDEGSTDNDVLDDDDGSNDPDNGREADIEDDEECSSSGALSENNSDACSDLYKASDDQHSDSSSLVGNEMVEVAVTRTDISLPQHGVQKDDISQSENSSSGVDFTRKSSELIDDASTTLKSISHALPSSIANCMDKSNELLPSIKQRTILGRTSARKNLSMESIDFSSEDEVAIQKLEVTKSELRSKVAKEIQGNEVLQASLEKRKELLHERRLALEQDVKKLQEQLQKEIDLRTCLEAGLTNLQPGPLSLKSSIDIKTRSDLEELALAEADIGNLKQMVTNLSGQLSHQLQHGVPSLCESCSQQLHAIYQSAETGQQKVVGSTARVHQNVNSIKTENSLPGTEREDARDHIQQDSPSSPDTKPSQKSQPNTTNQRSTKFTGSINVPSTESITQWRNTSSPKPSPRVETKTSIASRDENPMLGPPDKPSPQNLKPSTSNQSGARSTEEPTLFGRSTASKRSSFRGETVKKETPNTTHETTTPASSALAKLTSRLNFLKERRAQLANELQNLDAGRTLGPEGPPRTGPR